MRIARIEAIPVRILLRPERRMISALGRNEVSDYVLVRLSTDEGIEGVGEATATPNWSGETVWGTRAIIEHVFAPPRIGCDLRESAEVDRRPDAGRGRQLVRQVGDRDGLLGHCRPRGRKAGVRAARRSLPPADDPRIGSRSGRTRPAIAGERGGRGLVRAGFDTIKVKVGTGAGRRTSNGSKAVREAIGSDVALTDRRQWRLGLHHGRWRAWKNWPTVALTLVEQPLPRANLLEFEDAPRLHRPRRSSPTRAASTRSRKCELIVRRVVATP